MKKRFKGGKSKSSLREETVKTVLGITFFVLALFFLIASFDKAGIAGEKIYGSLKYLLGVGYFVIPLLLAILGIASFKEMENKFSKLQIVSAILFLFSGLGLTYILMESTGGLVGKWISYPLIALFEKTTSIIFLLAILIISTLIILDMPVSIPPLPFFKGKKIEEEPDESESENLRDEDMTLLEGDGENEEEKSTSNEARDESIMPKIAPTEDDSSENKNDKKVFARIPFVPIPLSLLEKDRGKPGVGDIKANVNIIKRTLQNFGIEVEMDEVSIGPSVTRYALKPAEGVKLSRIVALQNDLALALAAHPIRIEAPIPGKSLVGIEIPNSVKTTVGLGSLIGSEDFQTSEKPLMISLGKGISGKSYFGNLAKMPHLLIAGATGSGKSVAIHAIITSLLYRNSPDDLKFIMIDPKRVELTLYNKIPHLLTPVITDARKTILALKWAAKEMDRRYDILESESVRDIESYHKNIFMPAVKKYEREKINEKGSMPEAMPYIVVIIDELADIMATYPRELEASIVRLAQMSRAVGIHLILSTQRPSVNVITGLIKANIPARVALQVASQIDSRTILDMGGAEKLLGAGDMLYLSGEMSQPQRIQSAFISETEVKQIVMYLHEKYKDMIQTEINLTTENKDSNTQFSEISFDENSEGDDDDLYENAKEEVLKAGKASTSYLQRRLKIGYARAARLIDILEERGVIGPGEGAKPREVVGGRPAENVFQNNTDVPM